VVALLHVPAVYPWYASNIPYPPFGPTFIDIIRSCPTRAWFERTNLPRRRASTARIGIAFHEVIESFRRTPLRVSRPDELVAEVTRRFEARWDLVQAKSAENPREQYLPVDTGRLAKAIDTLVLWGRTALQAPALSPSHSTPHVSPFAPRPVHAEIEVTLASTDGRLTGRLDQLERTGSGYIIRDYKSSLRPDLPDRYRLQVQLYGALLKDSRGTYPVRGAVLYPFTGQTFEIDVSPKACEASRTDALTQLARLEPTTTGAPVATPGTVCSVCDFRPWCHAYWATRASTSLLPTTSRQDVTAQVVAVSHKDDYTRLTLARPRQTETFAFAPCSTCPQARDIEPGAIIRILDAKVVGSDNHTRVLLQPESELYGVDDAPPSTS
jgi:hypothetical protein